MLLQKLLCSLSIFIWLYEKSIIINWKKNSVRLRVLIKMDWNFFYFFLFYFSKKSPRSFPADVRMNKILWTINPFFREISFFIWTDPKARPFECKKYYFYSIKPSNLTSLYGEKLGSFGSFFESCENIEVFSFQRMAKIMPSHIRQYGQKRWGQINNLGLVIFFN